VKSHYKLSIIIPAYNPGIKIIHCLKSIEKSINFFSIKKKIIYEILIINDGGNKINLNFQKNLKNLRLINLKKNRGVGFSRQYGAEKSKYNYLFFIDSDIIIESNTIFCLFKDFEFLKNIGSIGPIQNYINHNKDLTSDFVCSKRCYGFENVKKYLEFSAIRSECCLIKKDFLQSVGGWKFFPNAGIEEFELGHRIIKKGKINYLTKTTAYSTYWDNLSTRCKNIIFRTSSYLPIFLSRKKFETKGSFATLTQALSSSATLLIIFFTIFFYKIEYFTEFLTILLFINLAFEFDYLRFAWKNFNKKNILLYPLGIFLINFSIIIGFLLGILNIIKLILTKK
jgi:glycosyltransferase involved in cell wall biosynthesis